MYDIITQLVTSDGNKRNTVKTDEYKHTVSFFGLASLLRLRSQKAIPVAAMFMSLVLYHSRVSKECINV